MFFGGEFICLAGEIEMGLWRSFGQRVWWKGLDGIVLVVFLFLHHVIYVCIIFLNEGEDSDMTRSYIITQNLSVQY